MILNHARLPVRKILTIGLLPSPLKILFYRMRGARIGKNVRLGLGTVIAAKEIEIDDGACLGIGVCISCARIKIGKRTEIRPFVLMDVQEIQIGSDVTISEGNLMRALVPGLQSKLVLHDRVHIFPFALIDPSRKVEIGEESCVGIHSSIFTHSSYKSKLEGYPVEFGEVNIGKGVWVSSNSFIFQSVSIGDEAIIGTGAVVSRDVPAGVLMSGSPARPIKTGEQYLAGYSEAEKFQMVGGIVDEFCQYLADFAGYTWQRSGADASPAWQLNCRSGKQAQRIELVADCSTPSNGCLQLVFNEVPEAQRREWDRQKKCWFSLGSRCCSAHLDDLGEELREYFKRYGLYFARP